MPKDLYVILQVNRRASPDEIRSAYRRRALELHPDQSGGGSEPFLELQEAYSVLNDPRQREAYDHGGDIAPARHEPATGVRRRRAEPLRQAEPARDFREVSLSQSFESFAPSFDDIFERLWSNFDLFTRPKAEHLESLTVDVPVSEEEAYTGGSVRILVPARMRCRWCGGHGGVGPYECWHCQGQGSITAEYPVDISYPAGLRRDYMVRVPLDDFGISNFYFTVRFRPSAR